MCRWIAAALVAVSVTVAGLPATAIDTNRADAMLRAVENQMRVAAPLRADGELTVASPDGTQRTPIILVYRPGKTGTDVYVELKRDGSKALILSDGAQAFRLPAGGSKAESFPPDATLADSEFAREDLEPFHVKPGGQPQISDENGASMTVTLVPKPSQYSLQVFTFDTERKLPIKTLYYRDTVNNMVKMRRDNDYVAIGTKWLPTAITMEDFKLRTESTLTLKWSQEPAFAPELFDPTFLARPSGLKWPEQRSASGSP